MMRVRKIINFLRKDTYWYDHSCSCDHILVGDDNLAVDEVYVCWVATMSVIKKAIEHDVHFIISHENCFYKEGTTLPQNIRESKNIKKELCEKNNITIYRCHDGWDRFPKYGVCDTLNEKCGFNFLREKVEDFHSYSDIDEKYTVKEIAQKVANALNDYGCNYVELFGDENKKIKRLGIGVGAISNTAWMYNKYCDCMILADDGYTNWIDLQWAIDNNISCIIYHHSINEKPGIENMANYLNENISDCKFVYIDEGYSFKCITSKMEEKII